MCAFCKGVLKKQTTTYTREHQGKVIIIKNVPAFVCSQCGEKYYSAQTIDQLHEALRSGEANTTETVPVFDFPQL